MRDIISYNEPLYEFTVVFRTLALYGFYWSATAYHAAALTHKVHCQYSTVQTSTT